MSFQSIFNLLSTCSGCQCDKCTKCGTGSYMWRCLLLENLPHEQHEAARSEFTMFQALTLDKLSKWLSSRSDLGSYKAKPLERSYSTVWPSEGNMSVSIYISPVNMPMQDLLSLWDTHTQARLAFIICRAALQINCVWMNHWCGHF